ncbi:nucleoside recognition domain-containing protein [Calothrix rhizosoleniae]|uniref:nucleoside recognition domain-containing protein n=1 Tax=Calothrix rhizosoleniae TaxID=888997 RepID=UPI00190EB6B4|nr:nucleoside recognition domain-containing protein [Calothrix rhizosoleniae]
MTVSAKLTPHFPMSHSTASTQRTIVVIGKENTGKSQLIASLTHCAPYSSNFRGSTITCERYMGDDMMFIDTPGILYRSDTTTTRSALEQLQKGDRILLVVKATHADEDLADLLPLVDGKQGIVVMTFWDKVLPSEFTQQVIRRWQQAANLTLITVNARKLTATQRQEIQTAIEQPTAFSTQPQPISLGWRIEPHPTLLEHPRLGWLLAIALLLIPAVLTVFFANTFAAIVDPLVQGLVNPTVEALSGLPSLSKEILIGRYGLITMGPLLFVWAVPTVILYALFLGTYKASGLVERITIALHPLLCPFGLSGRDLVRIIMGFGCNVPAVISTRACSSCSRKTCTSAIAFGSACSYQFGATLGVFSAANLPYLVIPYLVYLTITTLIYTRLIAPKSARSPQNQLMIEHRTFLEVPRWSAIWRETKGSLNQFFTNAIPIFLAIALIASVLDWLGVLNGLSRLIDPTMGFFRLPPEAALPVILASVRKDGLLLFAEPNTVSLLSPVQILTGVYLAGVLLPCLVTALTIAREQSPKFALKLMLRQANAAIVFTFILAWGGYIMSG